MLREVVRVSGAVASLRGGHRHGACFFFALPTCTSAPGARLRTLTVTDTIRRRRLSQAYVSIRVVACTTTSAKTSEPPPPPPSLLCLTSCFGLLTNHFSPFCQHYSLSPRPAPAPSQNSAPLCGPTRTVEEHAYLASLFAAHD